MFREVKMSYEKITGMELLESWINNGEIQHFIEETGITLRQIQEVIENDDIGFLHNELTKYTEKWIELYLCNQCGEYIDSCGYIHAVKQCCECAIGNGL